MVTTYPLVSEPLNIALAVSENATASGTESDMPRVRGLGPRDDPTGIDDILNIVDWLAGLSLRSEPGEGLIRPGLAIAFNVQASL